MNTAMPVGVEDFAEIRSNYYWVDKTAVISAFLQDHKKVTLFTRPRRFGKTLMLSMLRYFFDIEGAEEHRKLFDRLKVAQDAETMAQQGTRPVLFLTLKGWNGLSWDVMQIRVRARLGELFHASDFLLDDELSAWERDSFQAVLRTAKESIFSSLNNLKVDSALHLKYPEDFGYNEALIEKRDGIL